MSSPLEKGMASVSVSEDKKGGKKKSAAESGRSLEVRTLLLMTTMYCMFINHAHSS